MIAGLGRSPGEEKGDPYRDAKNREEQTGNSCAGSGRVLGPAGGYTRMLVFFIPTRGHLRLL